MSPVSLPDPPEGCEYVLSDALIQNPLKDPKHPRRCNKCRLLLCKDCAHDTDERACPCL